jgi:hypothetical protein
MGRVYKLVKKYGTSSENLNMYELVETQKKCIKGGGTSTPPTRVVEASGSTVGGPDNMLSELLEVVRAQEAQFDGQAIFYVVPRSDGDKPLKKKQKTEASAVQQKEVAVQRSLCKDELKFMKAASGHQFENCVYNPLNTANYVLNIQQLSVLLYSPTHQESQPSGTNLLCPDQHQGILNANYNNENKGLGTGKNSFYNKITIQFLDITREECKELL